MKSKSSIFILIAVAVILVVGLAYLFGNKGASSSSQQTGLVSTTTGSAAGLAATTTATTGTDTGDQVVTLLRSLSSITLDDSVFHNPSFALLSDLSIALPPVTNQGRRNPFAPVGNDSGVPVTSAQGGVATTGSPSSTAGNTQGQ